MNVTKRSIMKKIKKNTPPAYLVQFDAISAQKSPGRRSYIKKNKKNISKRSIIK